MKLTPFKPQEEALNRALAHICQTDKKPSERTLTARAYASALRALSVAMSHLGVSIPDRQVLEAWRDEMLASGLSVRTVNMRLSAVRKWLRLTADLTNDITAKLIIRDYANVENAKETHIQDKLEEDYGTRLSRDQVGELLGVCGDGLRGKRDKAVIALMVGGGLRVSEVCALTVEDALNVTDSNGFHGIRIRKGKHDKSRVAVIGERGHWVFTAIDDYLALAPQANGVLIRGVAHLPSGAIVSTKKGITTRAIQKVLGDYVIPSLGRSVCAHDLRRTYAYITQRQGMEWDALRSNMGHSSVRVTEKYVGHAVEWGSRVVTWELP